MMWPLIIFAFANDANHHDIAIGRCQPVQKSDFVPEIYVEWQGWDNKLPKNTPDCWIHEKRNQVFRFGYHNLPFTGAVATGTWKALVDR